MTDAAPYFSVVIATYNRARHIAATLDSLAAQEFRDFETVVVDDGSTDDTLEVLRGYPWVKVLARTNQGPGAARNAGVAKSRGRYVAFLDSDDIWFPWTLATFHEVLQREGEPELVGAHLELFWNEHELARIRREALQVETFPDYYAASNKPYFIGSCMMNIRRTTFVAAGGFTEERVYAEDADLAIRFGEARGFAQILAPVTLGYRQHDANARRDYALISKGIHHLVATEAAGGYPGGEPRKRERRRLICLHVRPFSVECLRRGRYRDAWSLYASIFPWQLRAGRWKYLLGFPVLSLLVPFGLFKEA